MVPFGEGVESSGENTAPSKIHSIEKTNDSNEQLKGTNI